MRLLLDENVPVRLMQDLAKHQVAHVRTLGWLGLSDNDIAVRATGRYDAILTLDQTFDKELDRLNEHPAIVIMTGRSHRLVHLRELLPQLHAAMLQLRAGQIVRISRPPSVLP